MIFPQHKQIARTHKTNVSLCHWLSTLEQQIFMELSNPFFNNKVFSNWFSFPHYLSGNWKVFGNPHLLFSLLTLSQNNLQFLDSAIIIIIISLFIIWKGKKHTIISTPMSLKYSLEEPNTTQDSNYAKNKYLNLTFFQNYSD